MRLRERRTAAPAAPVSLWLCLWLWLCAQPAAADEFAASAMATRYGDAGVGETVDVSYKFAATARGAFVNLERTQLLAGLIELVDLDAFQVPSRRWAWSEGFSYGSVTVPGADFALYKARVSTDLAVNGQWSVRLAEQYVHAAGVYGGMLLPSIEFRPVLRWSVKLGAGESLGGTLRERHGELALHYDGNVHLYAGLVAGSTGFDPSIPGRAVVTTPFTQPYAGASLPLRHVTLTLSSDALHLGSTTRETLRVGFVVALP